jgi:hypothetical protein
MPAGFRKLASSCGLLPGRGRLHSARYFRPAAVVADCYRAGAGQYVLDSEGEPVYGVWCTCETPGRMRS